MIAAYRRSSSSLRPSRDPFTVKGARYSCPVKVMESLPHSRVRKSTSAPSSANRCW